MGISVLYKMALNCSIIILMNLQGVFKDQYSDITVLFLHRWKEID